MAKYAVLGAGNAGMAFAGHLALQGFDVSIYEDSKFPDNIEEINKNGGIKMNQLIEGFGKVRTATYNMEEALEGADIIIIAVPQFAHEAIFTEYLNYAKDGQVVCFFPGNYAAFRFRQAIAQSGKDITLLEGESIPYGARKKAPGQVNIIGLKVKLDVACVPNSRTPQVIAELNKFQNVFVPAKNVLEVSLNNGNFVVHCTGMALNAGRVESTKGDFSLYWEGMSPSVCNVMEAIDVEVQAIGKAYGFTLPNTITGFKAHYELPGDTLYEVIQNSENHGSSGAPASLKDRYIAEDAPAGLCAMVALGEKAGIPTPVCTAILTICSTLNREDYYHGGLNQKNLGIEGLSIPEILVYVD